MFGPSRGERANTGDEKVASAVKTDFILSAEIMAITLAAVPDGSFWMQALVLAVVGIGITIAVYGVVALTTLAWLLPNTMEVQLSAG